VSALAGGTEGYGLERAREELRAAGMAIGSIERLEPAAGSSPNAEEFVVRQRPHADGTVELTVCRRWAVTGKGDVK